MRLIFFFFWFCDSTCSSGNENANWFLCHWWRSRERERERAIRLRSFVDSEGKWSSKYSESVKMLFLSERKHECKGVIYSRKWLVPVNNNVICTDVVLVIFSNLSGGYWLLEDSARGVWRICWLDSWNFDKGALRLVN